MTSIRTRYPGAQPFVDEPFSRTVFFGREQASKTLTDQILANRIVVVYGKSGLGKTLLLNAGVAPRLRDEGYLPLSMRVNDVGRGPLRSVLEGIRSEAERQQVEFCEGLPDSLWSFFKTAEFWRGDLLLTPVLILDQFEELFTLHSEQTRDSFLSELSFLVRGVPPQATQTNEPLTEGPPPIRIVLSLREDHLGLLEEAADHLPQILDHRFRLAPLTLDEAAMAMMGPAEIADASLLTRPFRYHAEAVNAVLMYLSRRRIKSVAQATRYIEPFQLQLICQRVEQVVAGRQRLAAGVVTITMNDIGGEAALRETLKNFYTSSVRSMPGKRARRAIRRLCEELLISPEGRRISLEENDIQRQLALSPETLRLLVAGRLLRSDNRSDSTYYELSHDALIEPVLATRRWRALLFGWLGLGITTLTLGFWGLVGIAVIQENLSKEATSEKKMGTMLGFVAAFVPFLILLIILFRRNLLSLRRYRPRTPEELADTLVVGKSRMSVSSGAIGIFSGGFMLLLALLLGAMITFVTVSAYVGYEGSWILSDSSSDQIRQSIARIGLGLDTIAYIISVPFVVLFGVRSLRWGVSRLLHAPRPVRSKGTDTHSASISTRALASSGLSFVAATIVLLAAVLMAVMAALEVGCTYQLHGKLPNWIPPNWFNSLAYDCQQLYVKGYDPWRFLEGTYVLAFLAEATRLFARRSTKIRTLLR